MQAEQTLFGAISLLPFLIDTGAVFADPASYFHCKRAVGSDVAGINPKRKRAGKSKTGFHAFA